MSLSEQNRALDSRARVEIDMESGLPQVRIVSEQTWITWSPSVSAFGVDIPVEQLVQQAKAFVAGLSPLAPRAEGATTAEGRQTAKRCRHGFPLADDEDGCIKCGEEDRAARAEGVAALQQAGEPVAWAMLQRDGSVLRVQAEPFHEGFAQMMETDCGCTVQALGQLYPLPQQTALVEQGVEKIMAPHEPAACGEGTLPSPSEPPRSDGWQDIASAPRDGTTIQARIPGHGSDNMIAWISDALDDGNGSCGAWTFVLEDQEPPSCWSDGWCWAVNEDGERSAEPTEWKPPMPEGEKP